MPLIDVCDLNYLLLLNIGTVKKSENPSLYVKFARRD